MSDDVVQQVWGKAQAVINNDPTLWRKDQCGAWIYKLSYGDRKSVYGWEIDHIDQSGGDEVSNLRPLHWINNNERSDGRLNCPIISSGVTNIRRR